MNGIPTTFKGRLYRSTLEAKWASFFDLIGWEFEYEPFETGDWIPDFLIRGAGPGVLVEVKPVSDWSASRRHLEKIERGAFSVEWAGDLLLLGVSPLTTGASPQLGWIGEQQTVDDGGVEWDWGPAVLGIWQGSEGVQNPAMTPGFCHESSGWHDRITGLRDGGARGSATPPGLSSWITNAWNRAASRVQWAPSETPDDSIRRMVRLLGQQIRR